MKIKNIYILVGLVLVIGILCIYVYAQNTWLLPPPDFGTLNTNKDFPAQIEICKGLSEEQCFANDNCKGSYGSSYCSPQGMCTMDIVFKGCGPSGLNSEETQQIRSECEKNNGELNKDVFGGYECLCIKPDYSGKYRCLEDLISQLSTN